LARTRTPEISDRYWVEEANCFIEVGAVSIPILAPFCLPSVSASGSDDESEQQLETFVAILKTSVSKRQGAVIPFQSSTLAT
jgi:hypothetical protein